MKIKLFKKYPIAVQTYELILEKIKESTDHYYMISQEKLFSFRSEESMVNTKKEMIHRFIYVMVHFDKKREKLQKRLALHETPIVASVHQMYEEFKAGKERNFLPTWEGNYMPLMHFRTGESSAVILYVGDYIRFLPFGGFVVYTTNRWNRFSNAFAIYKEIFIPNKMKEIFSIEEVNKQWDIEADKIEEELMRLEMEEEYDGYDY